MNDALEVRVRPSFDLAAMGIRVILLCPTDECSRDSAYRINVFFF